MTEKIDELNRYVEQHLQQSMQELARLCNQPSVSTQGLGMQDCAALTAELLRSRGIATQVIETGGHPVVIGTYGTGPRTLLLYNHYDVQPPEPLELWDSPPFEATLRDGKFFARGAFDDKGEIISRLAAFDAVRAVPVADEATIARVSQALLQKYATSSYAGPMVQDTIIGTTLRLEPASPPSTSHQEERENGRGRFSPEERAFLLSGTRTGKLATVRADGRPHIVPVAFDLDEDTLIFLVKNSSVKARNMQRDPRVCLCVDVETSPYAYIQVEGTAKMSADLTALVYWGRRIVNRYDGPQRAEAYVKRAALAEERVIRLTVTKVLFRKNIGGGS